jgi:prevent-host-death family protein
MATKTVDIAEAQASLPKLVSLVNAGVEVVLTKNSTPVACLVPMESPPAVRVSDDLDQPLSEEVWTDEKKAGKSADWLGCLEHLHVTVSEEDIAAARQEMWAGFPRELPQ